MNDTLYNAVNDACTGAFLASVVIVGTLLLPLWLPFWLVGRAWRWWDAR